jgi:hypothetical protein
MKSKKLIVKRLESVAFDNHQVHCSGDDVDATIHLQNKDEFKGLAKGDVLTLSLSSEKAEVASPKAKAPKAKKPKAPKAKK